MENLSERSKRSLSLFSLPLNMGEINIPRHMSRISWFLLIIAVVGGLLTTNPVSAENKLKCFSKIGDIKLGWNDEDQGLVTVNSDGIHKAVCRYPYNFLRGNPTAHASVLVQWCEAQPCGKVNQISGHFENKVPSKSKQAVIAEEITYDTHSRFVAAAQEFQDLKMDLLKQAERRAIPKDTCQKLCKNDHEIWMGPDIYDCSNGACGCEKGWEMKAQGCVSCDDICKKEGNHLVYNSEESTVNTCICECDEGYESDYDDSANKICKKVQCPKNAQNVVDITGSCPKDRKYGTSCCCDNGYVPWEDTCIKEGDAHCGRGGCEGGEDCFKCPEDCKCYSPEYCNPFSKNKDLDTGCSSDPKTACIFVDMSITPNQHFWMAPKENKMREYFRSLGYAINIVHKGWDSHLYECLGNPSTKAIAFFGHGTEPEEGKPAIPTIRSFNSTQLMNNLCGYILRKYRRAGMSKTNAQKMAMKRCKNLNLDYAYILACYSLDDTSMADYLVRSGGVYWGGAWCGEGDWLVREVH